LTVLPPALNDPAQSHRWPRPNRLCRLSIHATPGCGPGVREPRECLLWRSSDGRVAAKSWLKQFSSFAVVVRRGAGLCRRSPGPNRTRLGALRLLLVVVVLVREVFFGVVVGVGGWAWVVGVGWWDPFGGAVAAFAGFPAAGGEQPVVRAAGEGEVVDVG